MDIPQYKGRLSFNKFIVSEHHIHNDPCKREKILTANIFQFIEPDKRNFEETLQYSVKRYVLVTQENVRLKICVVFMA